MFCYRLQGEGNRGLTDLLALVVEITAVEPFSLDSVFLRLRAKFALLLPQSKIW